MPDDLYRRLKQIKQQRTATAKRVRPDRPPVAAASRRLTRMPSAWTAVAPDVYEIVTTEPLAGWVDRWPDDTVTSRLADTTIRTADLRFMDCETTGLSGGAGTSVFLVGIGRVVDGRLTVRQLLMADYPAEPAFLRDVVSDLGSGTTWVSYNGKAFDSRLLETRCIMNGMSPANPVHLDLLYWARRMWRRRLSDCSLGSIESRILARHRELDIPGVEIPERYFEFLSSGDAGVLEEVIEHHRQDIVSLGYLFIELERILETPEAGDHDLYQLGRWLLLRGDPRGIDLLTRVMLRSAPLIDAGDAARSAYLLARHFRRHRQADAAEAVLRDAMQFLDVSLAIEYAKFLEHDRHDPAAGLSVVLAARRMRDASRYALDLQAREERLRRLALRG